MSDRYDVNQRGNRARNIAGRDLNVVEQHSVSNLDALYQRLREEMESNARFRGKVDELLHYENRTRSEESRDLAQKMRDSGQEAALNEAIEFKEIFSKAKHRYVFLESAQRIFALLLGKVHILFEMHVEPLVEGEHEISAIRNAALAQVVYPVFDELGSNDLGLTVQHVKGMYYYLAGNCHLKWDT